MRIWERSHSKVSIPTIVLTFLFRKFGKISAQAIATGGKGNSQVNVGLLLPPDAERLIESLDFDPNGLRMEALLHVALLAKLD